MKPQERADTEEILAGILGDKSSWFLYGRDVRTPMTLVLDEAERTLEAPVNLYWVDGFSPEIFCLKNRPEPVVVFSTRFLEIWGDMRRIITDDRPEPKLKQRLIRQHLLQLIAEYAISMDDPEFAAVVSIDAAMQGGGFYYIPNTVQSLEDVPLSIRYMCCWFFALCHEIGHFTKDDASTNVRTQASDSEITELIHECLADLNLPAQMATKAEREVKDNPDRFILGINRIRSELNSDLFASIVLLVCTRNILDEVKNGETFSWAHYLYELAVALSLISLIDRCRRVSVYSCTAEPTDRVALEAILQPTAMSVRLTLLFRRLEPLVSEMVYGPTPGPEERQKFGDLMQSVLDAVSELSGVVDQSLVDVYKLTLARGNRGDFGEKLEECRRKRLADSGSVNFMAIQNLLERAAKFDRWSGIFTTLKNFLDDPARTIEYTIEVESAAYLCVGVKRADGSSQIFGLRTRYGYTIFIFIDNGLFEKFLELSRIDLPDGVRLESVALIVRSEKQLRYAVSTRLPVGTNPHLVVEGTKDFPRYLSELSSGEIFDTDIS